MKKIRSRKKFPLFTIAVIILSIILLYQLSDCIQEIRYAFYDSSVYSRQDYEYALQYHNYSYLDRICHRDTSSSQDEFIQACHSISDYYDAALLYHAYNTAKNSAAASRELQRMNDCETSYPDYEEYFRDIDQLISSPS